jgi:hypothetical protein
MSRVREHKWESSGQHFGELVLPRHDPVAHPTPGSLLKLLPPCSDRAFGGHLDSCKFTPMKSSMRSVGLYLLHLLVATFGAVLATGILLNVVLKPFEPLIGHTRLFSVAKGPYYPLPIVLAALAGYFSYIRLKSNYRFWVWIIPALYLVTKIALWKPSSVLGDNNWGTALTQFFAGANSYYPEEDIVLPFYTSLSLCPTHWGHCWTEATCFASSIRPRLLTAKPRGC